MFCLREKEVIRKVLQANANNVRYLNSGNYHLPMQKRPNIVVRISCEVMVPVMVPRWKIVSRRSWAIRSPERFASRASITRAEESAALASASQWRRFVTIMSLSAVSPEIMSWRAFVRLSIPVPFLAEIVIIGVSGEILWLASAVFMLEIVASAFAISVLFAAIISFTESSAASASAICGKGCGLTG